MQSDRFLMLNLIINLW